MFREDNAEVLVVGAGPVGMTAALLLAEQGVKATVIDAAGGTAAHSYACTLHPHTLGLLDRFGLVKEILEWGRRVNAVAFYDGPSKRAEVSLSALGAAFPFAVVLPQNALEWLLERTLSQRAGIKVNWHHRLSDLRSNGDGMIATVDEQEDGAPGGGALASEGIVKNTTRIHAPFLVGADGHQSFVRRCLGFHYERVGEPEHFMVFEFETDTGLNNEVRVVIDESTTNVLWPISSRRCRWSFQVPPEAANGAFPEKSRGPFGKDVPQEVDREVEQQLQQLIQERAPWFTGKVINFNWVTHVQFERRLTKQFTNGRCWLVGDAAHQTGPVGVQSFNVALCEADELADALKNAFNKNAAASVWETWNQRWREKWQQLLGLKGAPRAAGNTDAWIKRRAPRMLPCFPASGDDLARLLSQLHLTLP